MFNIYYEQTHKMTHVGWLFYSLHCRLQLRENIHDCSLKIFILKYYATAYEISLYNLCGRSARFPENINTFFL